MFIIRNSHTFLKRYVHIDAKGGIQGGFPELIAALIDFSFRNAYGYRA